MGLEPVLEKGIGYLEKKSIFFQFDERKGFDPGIKCLTFYSVRQQTEGFIP
jgi:hypothetical protein